MTSGDWITVHPKYTYTPPTYGSEISAALKEAIAKNNVEKIELLFLSLPNRMTYAKIFDEIDRFQIFLAAVTFGNTALLERIEKLTGWPCYYQDQYWTALITAIENGHIETVKYLLRKDVTLNLDDAPAKNYAQLLDKCFGRSNEGASEPIFILTHYSQSDYHRKIKDRHYAHYKKRTLIHKIPNCDNEDIARRELFECVYSHSKYMITLADLIQLTHGAIYFGFDQITSYILSLIIPLRLDGPKYIQGRITDFFETAVLNNRWNIVSQLLKLSDNLDVELALSQLCHSEEINNMWIIDELLLYVKELHRINRQYCDAFLNQERHILRCMKLERKIVTIEGFDLEKFQERKKHVHRIMTVYFPAVLINIIVDFC
ncbi:MAG: hypothetical protein Hyperionvirus16_4 [Hyperionvirus sp.]|uniref:Uncharacterized protein n=1 Tax=Hyperionvirus sp. TaxID=2487770 RepID=A0A3G5AF78_9VIRU|nr:MAG: hypothetical protein Hyperionvirus16_4 [Hyperionvirus sp.]